MSAPAARNPEAQLSPQIDREALRCSTGSDKFHTPETHGLFLSGQRAKCILHSLNHPDKTVFTLKGTPIGYSKNYGL